MYVVPFQFCSFACYRTLYSVHSRITSRPLRSYTYSAIQRYALYSYTQLHTYNLPTYLPTYLPMAMKATNKQTPSGACKFACVICGKATGTRDQS